MLLNVTDNSFTLAHTIVVTFSTSPSLTLFRFPDLCSQLPAYRLHSELCKESQTPPMNILPLPPAPSQPMEPPFSQLRRKTQDYPRVFCFTPSLTTLENKSCHLNNTSRVQSHLLGHHSDQLTLHRIMAVASTLIFLPHPSIPPSITILQPDGAS